jgi:hypothetical protein
LLHLAGGGADQTAATEGKHSYQLRKAIALTTLHDLANLSNLTISIKVVDRRTKHYSQAHHLVQIHQNFCLNANIRNGGQRNISRT